MSKKKDIKFLKVLLGMLQLEYEAILYRVSPEDMYSEDNIPDSDTPFVFERAARLAHKYGFDDNIFRDLIPGPPQDFEEFRKNFKKWKKKRAEKIKKQIKTIPRIIAKIEKSDEMARDSEMPSHYIQCTEIQNIIRKRSDAIARTLKTAKYPVIKKAGKNYCDPEHAAVLFPKWKKYWKAHQKD